jgi:hypothetical protein
LAPYRGSKFFAARPPAGFLFLGMSVFLGCSREQRSANADVRVAHDREYPDYRRPGAIRMMVVEAESP